MQTIIQLFEDSVKKHAGNPLLREKRTTNYESITYQETQDLVYRFAAGLMSLGVEKADKISLISEGRNDWLISELAILYCGAVNVPLSVKLIDASEIKFRINHSESKYIIVSNGQAKKIRDIRSDCPLVERIIYLDAQDYYNDDEIYKESIYEIGDAFLATRGSDFEKRKEGIKPNDYANICYTSGTTADPKGIILTHRNYTANVEQACTLMTIPQDYCNLLILPWDHSFAHTAGLYSFIYKGASIASVQSGKSALDTIKNIPINIKEVQPNLILSVPALAKNFKKNVEKNIRNKGKVAEMMLNIGLKTAYLYNAEGWNKGKGLRFLLKPLVNLFDTILFSKIREGFGGKLDFFIGGGALLDIDLQKFFYAIGIPMMQGYGLSEASPVISSNALHKHKLGSSGSLVSPMEIKILDSEARELPIGEKGEIVVKGENVMIAYWRNETATAETITNGWLHTGDMGYLDKDDYLHVVGRFKSLLIGNDGEKYSPEGIEEQLTEHLPFIDQVMLYNNQNAYTIGLLVLNKEAVRYFVNHHKHHQVQSIEEKSKHFLFHLQNEIQHINKTGKHKLVFPERWLPSSFLILEESFTEQNRMLNSTMKMVRGKITERYCIEIEYLYKPEGKFVVNEKNIIVIKKMIEN
ncbi:MAG: AMP-binding protein [Bacteroidetes bacterium]|nr:AMP-binding protein [Bacteroidota bacterium]